MGHLLAVRTKTGDQLHIAYVDDKYGMARRTSCGARVNRVLPDQSVPTRPGLLCVKCFHPTLPMENVRNFKATAIE